MDQIITWIFVSFDLGQMYHVHASASLNFITFQDRDCLPLLTDSKNDSASAPQSACYIIKAGGVDVVFHQRLGT